MHERTSATLENSKKTSRESKTNNHSSDKSKTHSSCNSCGACRALSSPRLSSQNASSAITQAKAAGRGSCAVSFMQRNYGNNFTARVLSPVIQKKCSCGGGCASCKGEEDADRVSRSIMRMSEPSAISYQPPVDNNEQGLISEIMSNKGSGQSLDDNTRSLLEPKLGYDFGHVRLHTDSYAVRKSNELNAEAFTIGRDIFFNAGRYNPSSTQGKSLLAHELTHVVQQGSIEMRRKLQKQKLSPFEESELKPLETLYSIANRSVHSCISILNEAVKDVYKEELKNVRLKSTIQDTMTTLESLNLVGKPDIIEFVDSTGKLTTGTIRPHKLSRNIEVLVKSSSTPLEGWYLYGLSIMDGYHSVLIAVKVRDREKKVFWLDQIKGFHEVTGNLDSEIENKTVNWWDGVKSSKGVGYRTRATIWTFVRILGDFSLPQKELTYV